MQEFQEKMHRGMNLFVRDESDDEREEGQVDQEEEEEEVLNPKEERLFKAITEIGKRTKVDVPTFLGNLNLEELINWINTLEEFSKYEKI